MSKHKPIKFEKTLEPKLIKEIEDIMKENKTAKTVLNATLAIAAVGGILTLGAIAPNAMGMLLKFQKGRERKKKEKYNQVWQSFYYLKKQRAIELVKEEDNCLIYKISEKGKTKIKKFILDELAIKEPGQWDEKWRLVIFDIPETKRKARYALVQKLREMGFYQCQKSVWIHPFPCVTEIEFLKDIFNIHSSVKTFIIDEMEDGKVLHNFKDLLKHTITKTK